MITLINIKNANIINEDWVNGEYHAFGPSSEEVPAGCSECSTSCIGDCSGNCEGGCGQANCEGSCSLSCESSCSADCTQSCSETCSTNCFNECTNGCKQLCTGACSGVCEGCTGCSGGCSDNCMNGCKHSCVNVSTTAGTHVVLPEIPDNITSSEDIEELLKIIKAYLDTLMQYDYTRISDLDEAVVVHDNDTLAGQIISHLIGNVVEVTELPTPSADYENKVYRYIGDTTTTLTQGYFYTCASNGLIPPTYSWHEVSSDIEDVGQINLDDMSIVISDFDNRTVRITAASFVKFIEKNYKNYYVWKPYAEYDALNNRVSIAWEFNSSGSDAPEPIDISDIIAGGIGRVTEDRDGLMPHELFASSVTHEFITGKTKSGDPAPAGTEVLRLTGDGPNTINESLLEDLDDRYAHNGQYMTRDEADQIYVNETDYASDKQAYLSKDEAEDVYLSKADAANTYADMDTTDSLRNEINRITNTVLPTTYLSKTEAANTYVNIANSTSQIPARIAPTMGNNGTPGLMLPEDIANLTNTSSKADQSARDIVSLDTRVTNLENGGGADIPTASTDYTTGTVVKGVVKMPVDSAIKVGNDGAIDVKDHTVTNLIKNGSFTDGFGKEWIIGDALDETISIVYKDQILGRYVANIAMVASGVISQNFVSAVKDGFTVAILFKKHATVAKTIEIKIDGSSYIPYTIPAGNGYIIGEIHIDIEDDDEIGVHTLYIRNPNNDTVSFELTEIMVQKGFKFTGWMRNPNESPMINSINIIDYENNITFKDLIERYTEDVYAQDGVTVIHRAGEAINPSSSIIMHKDKQYMYMHITALNEIDGQIRRDTIPLRIDLVTGECDISGHSVSAGTLIDNTGELEPSVEEINEFMNGKLLSLVDTPNEIEVTEMPTPSEEYDGKIYYYTGSDQSVYQRGGYQCVEDEGTYEWQYINGYAKKYKFALNKTVDSVITELASVPHVGRFSNPGNGEIFNDYVNNVANSMAHAEGQGNTASGPMAHAEGQGNTVSGPIGHVEGQNNTVSGGVSHAEGAGNIIQSPDAHVEGYGNKVTTGASYSHAEGQTNLVMNDSSHVECRNNLVGQITEFSAAGNLNPRIVEILPSVNDAELNIAYILINTSSNIVTDTFYYYTVVVNNDVRSWSDPTPITFNQSSGNIHAEGNYSVAAGASSHVEGFQNLIMHAVNSHAEGGHNTLISGADYAHVEGRYNIITSGASASHVEGENNSVFSGSMAAHIEGSSNKITSTSSYSHLEGRNNKSGYGMTNHVEGEDNTLSDGNNRNHVEGYNNSIQSGIDTSHVEGMSHTVSSGSYRLHIEGESNTISSGNYRIHVEGEHNTVNSGGNDGNHIAGGYNSVYTPLYSHIEGYGNTSNGRSVGLFLKGYNSTVEGGHLFLSVEGGNHNIPAGKSSAQINPTTGALSEISGMDSYGHIEGYSHSFELNPDASNQSVGGYYHIEGYSNKASYKTYQGNAASGMVLSNIDHIEGRSNTTSFGDVLHVEGDSNYIGGSVVHVEGYGNRALNNSSQSHIEGSYNTFAGVRYSHVEGYSNSASNNFTNSHIEGSDNSLNNSDTTYSHIEGYYNSIYAQYNRYSHIEGYQNSIGSSSQPAGDFYASHIEGTGHQIYSNSINASHIEGSGNKLNTGARSVYASHIEGNGNAINVTTSYSHIGGLNNTIGASGGSSASYVHAEGSENTIHNNYSHTEGYHHITYGSYSHVEGSYNTIGTGTSSNQYPSWVHVEGEHNTVHQSYSHVEGSYNTLNTPTLSSFTPTASHINVSGTYNTVNGGRYAIVSGSHNTLNVPADSSITSGEYNTNNASGSIVSGSHNIASSSNSLTSGMYNDPKTTVNSTNLLENATVTSGYMLNTTDGTTTAQANYSVTDFIEVDTSVFGYFKIIDSNATTRQIRICMYDENQAFLQGLYTNDTSAPITVNSNNYKKIKYIRVSAVTSYNADYLEHVEVHTMGDIVLVAVGNGHLDTSVTPNEEVRSNIVEVTPASVNINGDIYQNGKLVTVARLDVMTAEELAAMWND